MPSPTHADHTAARPPEPGAVDALISQTRRLRSRVDAVLRDREAADGEIAPEDARLRWQRALCALAVHQLDDLGTHLGQLKDGFEAGEPAAAAPDGPVRFGRPIGPRTARWAGRAAPSGICSPTPCSGRTSSSGSSAAPPRTAR